MLGLDIGLLPLANATISTAIVKRTSWSDAIFSYTRDSELLKAKRKRINKKKLDVHLASGGSGADGGAQRVGPTAVAVFPQCHSIGYAEDGVEPWRRGS